jgi:hypothetical protein
MCRKLCFLVCVVLFCAGTAVAVPIDDPNYNLSFEWHWPDCGGVITQIYGHTGIDAAPPTCDPCDPNQGVHNWLSTGSGFQGVDIFCPDALDSPTHCHNWPFWYYRSSSDALFGERRPDCQQDMDPPGGIPASREL